MLVEMLRQVLRDLVRALGREDWVLSSTAREQVFEVFTRVGFDQYGCFSSHLWQSFTNENHE